MSDLKRDIGDAVYVDSDGYHIWLTTEDGISVTNRIALEPAVWDQLQRWYQQHFGPKEESDDNQS